MNNNNNTQSYKSFNGYALAGILLSFNISLFGLILSIKGIKRSKEVYSGYILSIFGVIISIISILLQIWIVLLIRSNSEYISQIFPFLSTKEEIEINEQYCDEAYDCTINNELDVYTCKYQNDYGQVSNIYCSNPSSVKSNAKEEITTVAIKSTTETIKTNFLSDIEKIKQGEVVSYILCDESTKCTNINSFEIESIQNIFQKQEDMDTYVIKYKVSCLTGDICFPGETINNKNEDNSYEIEAFYLVNEDGNIVKFLGNNALTN